MKRRCLSCKTLIARGSRCGPCDVAKRGTWRQRDALRTFVLARDAYTCQDCRAVDPSGANLQADHIIELQDGGPNTAANMQTLCRPCHRAKGKNR